MALLQDPVRTVPCWRWWVALGEEPCHVQRCSHFSRTSTGNCRFLDHAREHTPAEIGAMLGMSPAEVDGHFESALAKSRRKAAEGPPSHEYL